MLQSTAEQTEEEAGVKEKNYSVAQNLFYIFHPVWKEKPHYMLMLIGEAVLSIGMMLMAAAVSAVAVSSLEKGNDVIVLIGSIMAFFYLLWSWKCRVYIPENSKLLDSYRNASGMVCTGTVFKMYGNVSGKIRTGEHKTAG